MKHWVLLAFALLISILVFIGLQFLFTSTSTPLDSDTTKASPEISLSPLPLGRHFMIGHWADTPVASTTALISRHQLAGVIIMSAPENENDIKNWVDAWQAVVDYPLMIAIDQEGGSVSRLTGNQFDQTSQPDITTAEEAYAIGFDRGQELQELGITMNFAPVLDTATKPEAFLYNRVFRHDPVGLASALSRGLREAGIIPVAKHFPGHPDTSHDSHITLPTVHINDNERADFIRPFVDYIKHAKPVALMTAHVVFPNLDPLPATISSYWLTHVLRQQIGYTGLLITDDMSMDAIDTTWTSTEASRLALQAGADIVLFAATPEAITQTLTGLEQEHIDTTDSDMRIRAYAPEA